MDILSGLNFVLSIIIGLLILVFLIVVHELGHAIAARRNGVVVEEFGIGFPPRAWGKKLKNGILFSLNWLPLGGFVKLQGENDAASKKGDYGAATFWVKTKILLAGVMINFLVAAIIFTGFAVTGMPKFTGVIDNQFTVASDTREVTDPVKVAQVVAGSPAAKAGLKTGDELIRIDGQQVPDPSAVKNFGEQNKGKTIKIIYRRDGSEHVAVVTLRADNKDGNGYLGIGTAQRVVRQSTWSAPIVGVTITYQLAEATLKSLGQTVANLATGLVDKANPNSQVREQGDQKINQVSQNVAGPIGILGVIFPSAREAGIGSLLFLTGLISLTLAVMNALPIPALDGGRWFLMALFKVLRRPLTKELEEKINSIGFLVLMGLIILVSFADVGKLIK